MRNESESAERMLQTLNRMIDTMAEAVLIIDLSGVVVAVNQAVLDLLDLPDRSAAFRPISEYDELITSWHLGDEPFAPGELRRCLEGRTLPRQVATVTTAAGTEHVIEFTATPIKDERNQVALGMMVASDITTQHRIRAYWQAVASSAQVLSSDLSLEELLNTVLDETVQVLGGQVIIGVWAVDETGRRLDMLAHRGLSEATACRVQALPLDGPSLICTAARTQQVLSTENTREAPPAFDLDRKLVEDEGLVSWIAAPLISGKRLLGAISYGSRSPRHFYEEHLRTVLAVAGLFGTALDHAFVHQEMQEINQHLLLSGLREQRLGEEAARKTAQLNALLESQTEGVTIVDSAGRIVMMNRAALEMSGYSEEARPRTLEEYRRYDLRRLDGSPLPHEDWPFSRAMSGEQFVDCELLLTRPDGARRRVLYSGSAIREDTGGFMAIIIHRDVTELRDLERLKREYIATISHDLRNPVTAVMGLAQMLERQLAKMGLGKEAGTAAIIQTSARRMESMIQDLVESAGLESGKMKLHKEPTDLNALLSDLAMRIGSHEDRQRLQIESTEWIPPISLDHARFERALTNLITNALKYSPPDSPVLVRVGRTHERAVVSVMDRGDGIAHDDLPHLFDRFYRAKNTAKIDGLGLGLYITRLIVEAHGGSVWAESELGKGSAFHISLPLGA